VVLIKVVHKKYENGFDEEENKDDAEPISGDKI
jgi:hypothetical protein